jgi:hypothetical protein
MLRNDLIIMLSEYNNDTVTVNVNGILIDVDSVTTDRDSIVLVLDPEDLQSVLAKVAECNLGSSGIDMYEKPADAQDPRFLRRRAELSCGNFVGWIHASLMTWVTDLSRNVVTLPARPL